MITRDVVVSGAPAPACYAAPDKGVAVKGAVVVVHEIFGRSPEMERVCHRFADAGWAALMPDLFGDGLKPVCIARSMKQIAAGQGKDLDVVTAAADVVAAESGVARDKVCVIGFCLGGGFALAVGHAFRATSANYATVLPPTSSLEKLSPTISCWGTRDRSTKKSERAVKDVLRQAGVEHDCNEFDAGHAFLADGSHPIAEFVLAPLLSVNPARDAAARDAAWQKIFAFFEKHAA